MKLNQKQLRNLLIKEMQQLDPSVYDNRIIDDMAELVMNAMANGASLKMLASAMESALEQSHVAMTGREVEYRVEITPSAPLRRRR